MRHHDSNDTAPIVLPELLTPLIGNPRQTHVGDGRYAIASQRRILGHGGQATVIHGRHAVTGCEVALRFLHSPHADRESAARTLQDVCRPCNDVRASRTPRLLDGFVEPAHDGSFVPVIATEFVPGATLYELLGHDVPVPATLVARLIAAASRVVHGIHEGEGGGTPVIHGDLKAANLIAVGVDPDADPRRIPVHQPLEVAVIDLFGLTPISGEPVATSRYSLTTAAPEQLIQSRLDPRTDVLGLGRTAVHLLFAGFGSRMTFDAGFFGGPRLRRLLTDGHRLRRPAARALDAILTAANHDDRDHRPSSAQAFAESLEDWIAKAA